MAERRMFAKTIVLSDSFLDMPLSSRCLYFTLGMLADDEGFINSPKSVMRQCGATNDDMNVLIAKKFIIPFESGVIVIKHWKIHNYIRGDRIHETKYKDEKTLLIEDENHSYSLCQTIDGQVTDTWHTEVRLGKDRIGKVNNKERIFDDEELEEAFRGFVEMRKKMKSPMTDKAIDLAVAKLKKLATVNGTFIKDDAIEIINQSVLNGWKGFYELKKEKPKATTQFGKFEKRDEDMDELAKRIFAN